MPAKPSTHHIPDEGVRFAPGAPGSVIHAAGAVQVLKDPAGDYEVMGCRPATEYAGDTPLLRVDLRRIDRQP